MALGGETLSAKCGQGRWVVNRPVEGNREMVRTLGGNVLHSFAIPSAPSKARLCQSGVGPDPGSPGQAPGTECCVVIGNADGEAYTGSARAAMRKREGIEPRYEKNRGCRRA